MATPRKPLGNAKRFKILQRDGFRCQYCGGTPPSVVLEVDHIVAVANGGDNAEENLVTACSGCNHGKFTRDVGAEQLPRDYAALAEDAKQKTKQLRAYQQHLAELRRTMNEAIDFVGRAYWGGDLTWSYENSQKERSQVERFIKLLGLGDVEEAARVTYANLSGRTNFRFRYFAGICWRKATERGLSKEDDAR